MVSKPSRSEGCIEPRPAALLSMTRYVSFFPLPAPYGKHFPFLFHPPFPKKGTTIMCEFLRIPESNIPVAGLARRLKLYQSVVDDLRRGDRLLTNALTQWRDEMLTRLKGRSAATRVRLPWIFVIGLQLAGQAVLLYEDGAVCAIGPKIGGSYMPGPVLISRINT
jgi:hypothetical protein